VQICPELLTIKLFLLLVSSDAAYTVKTV